MRRRWPWLALAALALAASAAAVPALRSGAGASAAGDIPLYTVARGEFERRVYADGNLEAVQATLLGPPPDVRQPLKIAWLAPDGSRVKQGDVVIRFDPTDLEKNFEDGQREREQSDNRITGKRVSEEAAQRNLQRDAELAQLELDYAREFQSKDPMIFSRADIIESEIDEELAIQRKNNAVEARNTRARLAGAELDLLAIERRKAEIKIEQASKGLAALEVTAPHNGIFVLKQQWGRSAEVGQTVWGGQPIAELPQMDEMQAQIYVLEADAGGLQPGLEADVHLEAHPDRRYRATVTKVDALAKRRNYRVPIQYFGVTLALERTDPEVMKPGSRLQAVLTLDRQADVVTVPRQAIGQHEGRPVVWVLAGGDFERRPVELGATGPGRVVVASGLDEGEQVALRDPTRRWSGFSEDDGGGQQGVVGGAPGRGG